MSGSETPKRPAPLLRQKGFRYNEGEDNILHSDLFLLLCSDIVELDDKDFSTLTSMGNYGDGTATENVTAVKKIAEKHLNIDAIKNAYDALEPAKKDQLHTEAPAP